MIVMAVVIVRMVVMGRCRVRVGAVSVSLAVPAIMMFDRVSARIARMRAEYGDQAGQNGAQQRQKDDCLNHSCVSPSSN
jgi:hypothetical protein